jgi:hypothetical protein
MSIGLADFVLRGRVFENVIASHFPRMYTSRLATTAANPHLSEWRKDQYMRQLSALLVATLLALFVAPGSIVKADTQTISISHYGTFLVTSQDPLATSALAIDLASLGVGPNEALTLEAVGSISYCPGCTFPAQLIGAFTDGGEPQDGIIPAGDAYVTQPTLRDGLPTDLVGDFLIPQTPGERLFVPPGATTLWVALPDSYYSDNTSDGLAVRITVSLPTVEQIDPKPPKLLQLRSKRSATQSLHDVEVLWLSNLGDTEIFIAAIDACPGLGITVDGFSPHTLAPNALLPLTVVYTPLEAQTVKTVTCDLVLKTGVAEVNQKVFTVQGSIQGPIK